MLIVFWYNSLLLPSFSKIFERIVFNLDPLNLHPMSKAIGGCVGGLKVNNILTYVKLMFFYC